MKLFYKVVALIALATGAANAQSLSATVSRQAGDVATRTDYVARFDSKLFGVGVSEAKSENDRVGTLKSQTYDDQEVFGNLTLPTIYNTRLGVFGSAAVNLNKNPRGFVSLNNGDVFVPVVSFGVRASHDFYNSTLGGWARRENYSPSVNQSTLGGSLQRDAKGLRVGAFGDVSNLNGIPVSLGGANRPWTAGVQVGSSVDRPTGFTVYGKTGNTFIDNPSYVARTIEAGLNSNIGWRKNPFSLLVGGALGSESLPNSTNASLSYYRAHAGLQLTF
jgi:hypothetical protein